MSARVAVIGTGYVGLTTGAYLAHLGHHVVCADVVEEKVQRLNRCDLPFFEAGLEEMVIEGRAGGRLNFVLGAINAVETAEFVFLCLPTPPREDGSADLSAVESVAHEIGPFLQPEAVVITKSTVPIGTTRRLARLLGRDDVFVVSNPEFLREGTALHDCLHPDRIVIGSDQQEAALRVATLFEHLEAPLIVTDPASAEAIKYASNAFLATKVSFINAMAQLCEVEGADVRDVALGMGYDKRIGFEFLRAGPGWGGSCLPPDETVLVLRGGQAGLWAIGDLFAEVERTGSAGWEVLAWRDGDPAPEFLPVVAFTARPFAGELVEVTTKMGRRFRCTPDHPLVVGTGQLGGQVGINEARSLTTMDWLPITQHFPLMLDDRVPLPTLLDTLKAAGIRDDEVIVRMDERQKLAFESRWRQIPAPRRHDVRRSGTARLSELKAWGLPVDGGALSTVTNGTYVPFHLDEDVDLWRIVGLFLAEGHIGRDGRRERICWSFHPEREAHLVEEVASFWRERGVKASIQHLTTTCQVSVSSRILAAWFEFGLGVGRTAYDHRVPDAIWLRSEWAKWQLLAGAWEGDGSWSLCNGGPRAVLQYGTVSRLLADGILRLLGDLAITARLRVGRTAKSTVDTYWITISGADQLEAARWLFTGREWTDVQRSVNGQSKRIKPTGYRRLSKNASWVRVTGTRRVPYEGYVYSLEVEDAHTFVTSGGVVVHNCFPKDSRALIRMAADAGLDFDILRAAHDSNQRHFGWVVDKIERVAGGSLDGCTVAVWGITFKARTDDTRESPSLFIIEQLRARGAKVQAYDPMVRGDIGGIEVGTDPYAVCEGAHVLAVLTEWDDFKWMDMGKVGDAMAERAVVDARNLLEPSAVRRAGFTYESIGRP